MPPTRNSCLSGLAGDGRAKAASYQVEGAEEEGGSGGKGGEEEEERGESDEAAPRIYRINIYPKLVSRIEHLPRLCTKPRRVSALRLADLLLAALILSY